MPWLIFAYPWLELLSLIQLGIETNALFALGWVFAMFFVGGAMLRWAGNASMARLREAQAGGVLRQHLLVDDMAVAIAALLLIIPGLVSDLLAVIVLIGPLRRVLARMLGLSSRAEGFTGQRSRGPADGPVTLEGDFTRVDADDDTDSINKAP